MGEKVPGPICAEQLGAGWVDDGTLSRSRSMPPGPSDMCLMKEEQMDTEPPTFLEKLRQMAVIGTIIGIRKGIAMVNPMALQGATQDEQTAQRLMGQGDYERAFEVATGFAEYFVLYKKGKLVGASNSEIGGTMIGHATGFNQAMETAQGQTVSGEDLKGIDRFLKGLEALLKIASTALTILGGVGSLGPTPKIVSPIYRIGGRDIAIVETSVGRQAFYRSTGVNSKSSGQWFPVDEIRPADGWFNKAAYTQGPGLEKSSPLHRLGSEEFAQISKKLGKMSIPKGHVVPAGKNEVEEMTMNRILDFFGARTTPTTVVRPVPER